MKKSQLEIINFLYEEEQRLGKVFMDKSLSEGCLIEFENNIYTLGYAYEIHNERGEEFLYGVYDGRLSYSFNKHKIIGHYGLDSILKYIKNQKQIYGINFEDNILEIYSYFEGEQFTIGYFPNKSPNLYTDKENEALLKLLKQ